MIRKLIALVLVASGLWFGYWYVASTAKQEAISAWLQARKADGWKVAYDNFRVVGFPNRIDSKFKNLDLRDPVSGVEWQAPDFQILTVSYRPNHVIVIWPDGQTVTLPDQKVAVNSTKLVASVAFVPDTKLALARSEFVTDNMTLQSDQGWQASLGHLGFFTRQHKGIDFAHDVVFDAKALVLPAKMQAALDPGGRLPKKIDRLYLDTMLSFDAPWDRLAVERGRPQLTRITVNKLKSDWGDLGVEGNGVLDVAANGRISGALDLQLHNWQALVDMFVASGTIDGNTAELVKGGLGLLAGSGGTDAEGNAKALEVTLRLEGGRMFLGPIPLGRAPHLYGRTG